MQKDGSRKAMSPDCFGANRENVIRFQGLLPESQGQSLVLTVSHVPYFLDGPPPQALCSPGATILDQFEEDTLGFPLTTRSELFTPFRAGRFPLNTIG